MNNERFCITVGVGGRRLDHLAINSTTAVAADARVNPALPATAVVEFMAKWLNLYPRTVVTRNLPGKALALLS